MNGNNQAKEKEQTQARGGLRWSKVLVVLVGLILIISAIALYLWVLLSSLQIEAWLLASSVILVILGIYLLGKGLYDTSSIEEINKIRRDGPGIKETSEERKAWIEHQTRRAYWLRTIFITIISMALASYADNHVIGPQPDRNLQWQTHSERQIFGNLHPTKEGDTLAKVAQMKHVSMRDLALANPSAQLVISDVVTPSVGALPPLGTIGISQTYPLEVVAEMTNESTPEAAFRRVALSFSTVPLLEGQSLVIPTSTAADPRQWLDWILWGLIGVSIYLLLQIAQHYRLIPEGKEADFISETPWYLTQLWSGPIVAFVVLLFFTNINLRILGDEGGTAIVVDFSAFPPDLLFVPAFLLGFYSRVARHVLDQIMQSIFGSAWRASEGEFSIIIQGKPDEDIIQSGSTVILETKPLTPVTWMSSDGKIEPSGAYTAPPDSNEPKDVTVTAVARGALGGNTAAKVIRVVPLKFDIVVVENRELEVARGDWIELTIDPMPSQEERDKITWSVKGKEQQVIQVVPNPITGAMTTLNIPIDLQEKELYVQATYKGYSPTKSLIVKDFAITVDGGGAPEVKRGGNIKLTILPHPSTTIQKNITWSVDPADPQVTVNPVQGATTTEVSIQQGFAKDNLVVKANYNGREISILLNVKE